jgi:hypothetical protein
MIGPAPAPRLSPPRESAVRFDEMEGTELLGRSR